MNLILWLILIYVANMYKYIIHIADIHIHDTNYNKLLYSFMMFERIMKKLLLQLKANNMEIIICIVGDIFEYKTKVSSNDIILFNKLISLIDTLQINTIIIPGNHDTNCNINNFNKTNITYDDLISSLLINNKSNYVKCYNKTGVYTYDNINFYVHSVIDKQIPSKINSDNISVSLIHDTLKEININGVQLNKESKYNSKDLSKLYDFTLLGDIHKYILFCDNVAYCGSFVQKNIGESIDHHGFILWDIFNKKSTFYEVPSTNYYVKTMAINNKCELPNINNDHISRIEIVHKYCTKEYVDNLEKQIYEKYNLYPEKIIGDIINNSEDKEDDVNFCMLDKQIDLIKCRLKDKYDDKFINDVIKLHMKCCQTIETKHNTKWKLKSLSWYNMMSYGGNKLNYINFDDINNINLLFGPNKIGKSSIIDILIFILFNKTIRGTHQDIISIGYKNASIKCIFSVNDNNIYEIERAYTKSNIYGICKLYRNGVNITQKDIDETYKYISNIIGKYEDVCNLFIYTQERELFPNMKQKKKYIAKYLNLDILSNFNKYIKTELTVMKKINKQNTLNKNEAEKRLKLIGDIKNIKDNLLKAENELKKINFEISSLNMEKDSLLIKYDKNIIDKNYDKLISDSQNELSKYVNENYDKFSNHMDQLISTKILLTNEIKILTNQFESIILKSDEIAYHNSYKILTLYDESIIADYKKKYQIFAQINSSIINNSAKFDDINMSTDDINIELQSLENLVINLDINYLKSKLITITNNNIVLNNESEELLISIDKKYQNELDEINKELNDIIYRSDYENMVIKDINTIDIENMKKQYNLTDNDISTCSKLNYIDTSIFDRKLLSESHLDINDLSIKINELTDNKRYYINESINIDNSINNLRNNIVDIELLRDNIMAIKSNNIFLKLSFNNECECCLNNQNVITNINSEIDIKLYIDKLNNLNSQLREYENIKLEYNDKLIDIDKELIKYNNMLFDMKSNEILKLELLSADKNNAIIDIILVNNHRYNILNVNKNKIIKLIDINNIKLNILHNNKIQQNIDNIIKYNLLKQALIYKQYIEYKNKIDDIEKYEKYRIIDYKIRDKKLIDKKLIDIRIKLRNITDNIEYINVKNNTNQLIKLKDLNDINKNIKINIDRLEKLLNDLNNNKQNLFNDINNYKQLQCRYDCEKQILDNVNKILEHDIYKYSVYDCYKKCIDSKYGIQNNIILDTCKLLITNSNKLLEMFSDFHISCEYKENKADFYINDRHNKICIALGSGYQKFIIDFVMRLSIIKISSVPISDILFIDEGFGCADNINIKIICSNLNIINQLFNKCLIITHITEMFDYISNKINITKIHNNSFINFGQHNNSLELTLLHSISLPIQIDSNNYNESDCITIDKQNNKFNCKVCNKDLKGCKNSLIQLHLKRKSHIYNLSKSLNM